MDTSRYENHLVYNITYSKDEKETTMFVPGTSLEEGIEYLLTKEGANIDIKSFDYTTIDLTIPISGRSGY